MQGKSIIKNSGINSEKFIRKECINIRLIQEKAVYLYVKYLIMKKELIELFERHNGYLTKNDIDSRILYDNLLKQIELGVVERVKRGVYYFSEVAETMIDVSRIVPGGVLCLYSAWFYYDLTLSIPQSYNIAIEKKRKIKVPDYPSITLFYWQREYYELGVTARNIEGFDVDIYDLEKCVCDAVKYRNKVGIEVVKEVIQSYVKRQDRNFSRLIEYARKMRIEKTIRTYLEVSV